tara:strand:+ start:56 stop:712 length:657 start_codon:yes stop_codon:yes gene_type:complete
MSESVIKKIEDILKNKSELKFNICSTPYGRECTSRADFNDEQLSKSLKEAVLNFDSQYHDENHLNIGDSRIYKFTFEKEMSLEILYHDHHEYSQLEEHIKKHIIIILSEALNCKTEEFEEKFYFTFKFSTIKKYDEDMRVYDWKSENEVKVDKSVIEKIKQKCFQLSHEFGRNTFEDYCEFEYELSSDEDFHILESWNANFEFKELKENLKFFNNNYV